jgi:hypothetical protein
MEDETGRHVNRTSVEKLNKIYDQEDLHVDGNVILKLILEDRGYWLDSPHSG